MNAEVLREANATTALYKAQTVRASAYLSYVAKNLNHDAYAQISALADGLESLAKAVLGLEDTSPPDLRVIYGDAP
jgi:hypothetical protein